MPIPTMPIGALGGIFAMRVLVLRPTLMMQSTILLKRNCDFVVPAIVH